MAPDITSLAMWSDVTTPGDLIDPLCDLSRIRAVALRLSLCVKADFLTPAVCIDRSKDFWPPRWYSPETPSTPIPLSLIRSWHPNKNPLLPAGKRYVFMEVDQYIEVISLNEDHMLVD